MPTKLDSDRPNNYKQQAKLERDEQDAKITLNMLKIKPTAQQNFHA